MFSVRYDNATHRWWLEEGSNGIASGTYYKHENSTKSGWDVFEASTDGTSDDDLQAFAIGFLEGALSADRFWDAWQTYDGNALNATLTNELLDFIAENQKWLRYMSANAPANETTYWTHVGLVLAQLDGVVAGYNAYAKHPMSATQVLLYQLSGETNDILTSLGQRAVPETPAEVMFGDHCSVLIKPTDDQTSLFASHVSWSAFFDMLRTYKRLTVRFRSVPTAAPFSAFSSTPGFLASGDDFYITSQNLVVMETTNSILNKSLYRNINTQTVPYFVRNVVANRMASSGAEWTSIFAMYNSGTYNNQWMVVDYKLFKPGQPLVNDTLWIAEQIPGYVGTGDVTYVLRDQGYWPSYNIPFFPYVYNVSGYPEYYEKFGDAFSYTGCPRARIFSRDHDKVVNMSSMQHLMRYNQWQTDPLSLGSACNGISARCDLDANSPAPFGGVDCKVTEAALVPDQKAFVVNGPTWDSQPVFAWTAEWRAVLHFGQPTVFDFEFDLV